jgi:hypothetical protein
MYVRSRSISRRFLYTTLLVLACLFPLLASSAQASSNVLTFSSVNHNFGSSPLNGSVKFGMKVTNSSTTTNYINFQINISGSSEFSEYDSCSGGPIVPGGTCEVIFVFTPTALGTATATWNLTGTGDSTFSYSPSLPGTLTGLGINNAGLTITTSGHNFGTVFKGTPSSPYGVVITNSAVDPVALEVAAGNTQFAQYAPGTNCPGVLQPNQSCNVAFEFIPSKGTTNNQPTAYSFLNTVSGTDTVTMQPVIVTNGSGGQISGITLTGFGITQSTYLGLSTSVHYFGEWKVANQSNYYGVQLINTTNRSVVISYSANNFSNFQAPQALDNCFPNGVSSNTLQAGQSCQVQIAFLPKTTGALSTTFGLTATQGGTPINVEDMSAGGNLVSGLTLSGTGVSGGLLETTSQHDFGAWAVGSSSSAGSGQYQDTLTNTTCASGPGCGSSGGTAFPITVTLKTPTGFANNFSRKTGGTNCTNPQTLTPAPPTAGSTCNLTFNFAPTVQGESTALFGVSGVDANTSEPVGVVAGSGQVVYGETLSGYGTPGTFLYLATASNNFGEQGVGGSSGVYTTYLYNATGSTVDMTYAYSNSSLGSNFTLTTPVVCSGGSSASVVINHGYCTFQWTFNPNEVGPISVEYDMTATTSGSAVTIYNIASGDPAQPVTGVTLSGTGIN